MAGGRCTMSPFRQQSNGRCERFNDTLKSMLKKLCAESVKEWELVPYAVFAYCKVLHDETVFSSFEMLYGRPVRGLMVILRGLLTAEDEKQISVIGHVITIRNRLAAMPEMVKEKIKAWYDKRLRFREFEPGGEVKLLLPLESSKNNANVLSRI